MRFNTTSISFQGNQQSAPQIMTRPQLIIPQKKRALVLPGGGGRGAYQVGVAKAFKEVGIEFDFIFGTSIGGLNGAMIGQGSIERLEELWSNMRPWDIFK